MLVEGCKDTYYIISLHARATTQHANTQGVCVFEGEGVHGTGFFYLTPPLM